MNRIELTGIRSGVPIGFLAALGTFRHASRMGELGETRLAWTPSGGEWRPTLHTTHPMDVDGFIKLLLDRIQCLGDRREFTWSGAVKSATRGDFVKEARKAIEEASADEHDLAGWFAAFGSELALNEGLIESTPFDMTVARQQFLADADWLTKSLATVETKDGDAMNMASLREALTGPWKYKDNQHSLGWDPSTLLMGAFTPKAPTAMPKAGVRGAVWLAMESLPYFPCFYDGGLATCGFTRTGRKQHFVWPVWTEPLTDASIRTLLSQMTGTEIETLKARGAAAVYASEVYKPNKYLTSFQPAVLLG